MFEWLKAFYRWLPPSEPKEKTAEDFKYHAWIPDGSGRSLHTDDEETYKLAKEGYYVRGDGKLACITCGGNCGQCGNTSKLGNIGFEMQSIINSLHCGDYRIT